MSETVLTIKDLKKNYGKQKVLKGVNMTVNKGDIYGLVGKNGAGKTTLFKVVLGLPVLTAAQYPSSEDRMEEKTVGIEEGSDFL